MRTAPSAASTSCQRSRPSRIVWRSEVSASSDRRSDSTWPPWKPMAARRTAAGLPRPLRTPATARRSGSTHWNVSCGFSHRLDELGQDAAGALGVQERDLRAPDAGARRLVDAPQAGLAGGVQRALDARHPGGDVMQAGAPRGQEAPHGRVLGQRREQLDVALAHVEQHGLDALPRDGLTVRERHAVGPGVELDRRLEVGDRDPDVVDAAEHPPEGTLGRGPARGGAYALGAGGWGTAPRSRGAPAITRSMSARS